MAVTIHALRAATARWVAGTRAVLAVAITTVLAWAARRLAATLVTVGTFVARRIAVAWLRLADAITTVFTLGANRLAIAVNAFGTPAAIRITTWVCLASPAATVLPLGAGTHTLIDTLRNLGAVFAVLGRAWRVAVARHARAVYAALVRGAAVVIATNLLVWAAARPAAGSPGTAANRRAGIATASLALLTAQLVLTAFFWRAAAALMAGKSTALAWIRSTLATTLTAAHRYSLPINARENAS